MSSIDLERLRVKRTFFVPIRKENLINEIHNELNKYLSPIADIPSWTFVKHGNTLIFRVNYKLLYIGFELRRSKKKKGIEMLSQEYDKNIKAYFETLKNRVSNEPDTIFINILKCDENGCEVEVECLPTLYRKISQLEDKDIDEYQIQDAYITCERFLRTIFVGGLSGTAISEQKMTIPKPKVQLLINDVSNREITEKLNEMLDGATAQILIFGWMGTIFLKKLQELKQKGVEIKLITGSIKGIRQDLMRKEKEKAIKELISIIGKDHISIKPEFHGRAIIVDNKALIGSMDLDSYSLTGTRIEFAIYTEDPEIVRRLRNYFIKTFTPWKEEQNS